MGTAKRIVASLLLLAFALLPSAIVRADALLSAPRVLINEIQTESATDVNQEFIEIVNVSGASLDLSGWSMQYRAATGTSWADKVLLTGQFYAGGSLVIASQGYLIDIASFNWAQAGGVLASTGGNVRLMPPNSLTAEDTVAWGTGVYGENTPVTKAPKGSTIQRKVVETVIQDSNNNSVDFETLASTPIHSNTAPVVIEAPTTTPPVEPEPQVSPTPIEPTPPAGVPNNNDPDPEVPLPIIPPAEVVVPESDPSTIIPEKPHVVIETPAPTATDGEVPPSAPLVVLAPLIINELMINPGAPQNDADDEWVELYNPNETEFVLTGYKLQTGSTFSHSYTFTEGTITAHSFLTIYSSQSGLALSNTSGGVRVVDPSGSSTGYSVAYDDVEEYNSYALNGLGQWLWTTTPTPSSSNIFTAIPELIPPLTTTAKKSTRTTTTKTATPKTTVVKSASIPTAKKASAVSIAQKATKASAQKGTKSTTSTQTPAPLETPSHPVALAGFAIIAVGYALYEYRNDISNKLRIARRYLEARRGSGPGL